MDIDGQHTMANFTCDMENWMTNLPDKIRSLPIINLAIPGSHDSMSYGIPKARSAVAPDASRLINFLHKLLPCVIRRWAITQKLTTTQQLKCGVRYFDLRICLNRKDNKFYFVHSLYCEEISDPLIQIQNFLETHPGEFVILDCQHFYDFSESDYDILANNIFRLFEKNIYGYKQGSLLDLSLKSAAAHGTQVLVVYRNAPTVPSQFWPSDYWPTPWPNQINVSKLEKYLDLSLDNRSKNVGFVTQCVVTPPVNFIIPRFFMSLRRACAERVRKGLFHWITKQTPGQWTDGQKPTSNVFIADFVDLKDSQFCKIVVNLNTKLLN